MSIMGRKKQVVKINKNSFEKAAWDEQKLIVGIDEVGRGCLAGPLMTAAVMLPANKISHRIKDSKLMSEPERLLAYKWIVKHCWYGVGIVSNRIIDQHNIWQATLIAMKKALVHLLATCPHKNALSAILVDAMPLNIEDTSFKDIPIHYFPKGEQKSSSIAAASIIAKVTRDQLMQNLAQFFPAYKLEQNKGYATKIHRKSIAEHNHTIIHRMSFLNNMRNIKDSDYEDQQELC